MVNALGLTLNLLSSSQKGPTVGCDTGIERSWPNLGFSITERLAQNVSGTVSIPQTGIPPGEEGAQGQIQRVSARVPLEPAQPPPLHGGAQRCLFSTRQGHRQLQPLRVYRRVDVEYDIDELEPGRCLYCEWRKPASKGAASRLGFSRFQRGFQLNELFSFPRALCTSGHLLSGPRQFERSSLSIGFDSLLWVCSRAFYSSGSGKRFLPRRRPRA